MRVFFLKATFGQAKLAFEVPMMLLFSHCPFVWRAQNCCVCARIQNAEAARPVSEVGRCSLASLGQNIKHKKKPKQNKGGQRGADRGVREQVGYAPLASLNFFFSSL